jgi:hypothetical protein
MQTIRVVLIATLFGLFGFGKTLCELLRTARREP